MTERIAEIYRKTNETEIRIHLNLDGTGQGTIQTGIGFFDHMLYGFARHGLFDLNVQVTGDLEVDTHHTIEDVGIVLGTAIKEAIGEKKGIRRFGFFLLPMDESLALCAIDACIMCGRSFRPPVSELSGGFYYRKNRGDGYGDDPGIFLCRLLQCDDESASETSGRRKQSSYGRSPL